MADIAALGLSDGPLFFAQLQRQMPGISAKVLAENLHVFERNGLVRRQVYDRVPPAVEYGLTDRGNKLISIMESINGWMDDV